MKKTANVFVRYLNMYTCALIVPNEAIRFDHFPVCIGTVEDKELHEFQTVVLSVNPMCGMLWVPSLTVSYQRC